MELAALGCKVNQEACAELGGWGRENLFNALLKFACRSGALRKDSVST